MYHSFLIHSSADGHLGCFHVLPIINNSVMNLGYTCLFPFWFPQCVCPAVGLLDHKAVLFPVTFRSLIHFEFIFVCSVRKCSNFILLQVVDQFSQHHSLNRLSYLHCIFVPLLLKIRCIGAWIYLWPFYLVPLIYMSVFVPVPYCLDDCGFVVILKSGSQINF